MPKYFLTAILLLAASVAEADVNYSTLDRADGRTRALVKKVVDGLGGELTLRKIQSIRKVATIREAADEGGAIEVDFTGIAVFPDSLYAKMTMSDGQVTAVSMPRSSHIYSSYSPIAGAAIKMAEDEKNGFLRYFFEDPIFVLRNRIDPKCLFAHGGRTRIEGRELEVLFVRITAFELQWFVDPETGRVVRTVTDGAVSDFADFRKSGEIVAPFTVRTTVGGRLVSAEKVTRYDLNPTVEPNAFAMPTLWLSRQAFLTQRSEWQRKAGRRYYDYDDDSRFSARTYLPPPSQRVYIDFW